ncbi:MAG: hypothetical protein ACI4MQ_07830 [Candidatus Coproplasma sp.]
MGKYVFKPVVTMGFFSTSLSKYANNPALGIKQAANLFGADTDTIAAMTGGLMGKLSMSPDVISQLLKVIIY